MNIRKALVSALISTSVSALATAAHAQQATVPAANAQGTGQPAGSEAPAPAAVQATGGLEDIIVTARKRVESVQNIPVSVTAFSPKTIQHQDLSTLEKLSSKVPDLVITRSSSGSGASLSIRGIGSNFTSVGIEQSVAVIVDGTYYGHGRVLEEGFFDLAQIEVLKGPQALFFGKNATAGVISIATADPGSKPEFMLRGGYEFTARQIYGEAVASVPLTDTLGVRVAIRAEDMFGGYSTNRASDATYTVLDAATFQPSTLSAPAADRDQPQSKELLGRITIKWAPTTNLTDTLKVSGTHSRAGSPGYNAYVDCPSGYFQLNPTVKCGGKFDVYLNNIPSQLTGGTSYLKQGLYNDYDSYSINNTLNYNLSHATFTSVLNFNKNHSQTNNDYAAEGTAGIWTAINSRFQAFSSETRLLTSFDFPVNFLAGFYYQSSKRFHEEDVAFLGAYNSAAARPDQYLGFKKPSTTNGKTYSPFAQLIWKVTPKIEITGGARYTHETKDSTFIQPYVNPFFVGVFLEGVPIARHQGFNNVSPEATVTYRPTSDITLYAAYKTGYKSGGFSNSAVQTPADPTGNNFVFGPEKAKGFEIGAKTTLFDRQLRFDVGAYRYNFTGLQVDYYDPIHIAYITKNAGSSRVEGIEAALEFAPRGVPGLTVHGTVNYNKARYRNFVGPCWTGESQGQGCSIYAAVGDAIPSLQQLGGSATANAPSWTGTAGFDYSTPVSETLRFGVSADVRYSDRYNASPFNSPYTYQRSYATLDASARIATLDDRWELAVIGKNLTNREIKTGVFDITGTGSGTGTIAGGTPSDFFAYSALPRTVQAQVTLHF